MFGGREIKKQKKRIREIFHSIRKTNADQRGMSANAIVHTCKQCKRQHFIAAPRLCNAIYEAKRLILHRSKQLTLTACLLTVKTISIKENLNLIIKYFEMGNFVFCFFMLIYNNNIFFVSFEKKKKKDETKMFVTCESNQHPIQLRKCQCILILLKSLLHSVLFRS